MSYFSFAGCTPHRPDLQQPEKHGRTNPSSTRGRSVVSCIDCMNALVLVRYWCPLFPRQDLALLPNKMLDIRNALRLSSEVEFCLEQHESQPSSPAQK